MSKNDSLNEPPTSSLIPKLTLDVKNSSKQLYSKSSAHKGKTKNTHHYKTNTNVLKREKNDFDNVLKLFSNSGKKKNV